jgi:hypothetical protein
MQQAQRRPVIGSLCKAEESHQVFVKQKKVTKFL